MDYPKISVILPVRNEEKYLAKAVESVLSQNYPGELEVLLAIAPSEDATSEIAQKLVSENPMLKIVENPAGLTTIGMNLSIAQASGEVIIRVDAHSELGPNYLTRGVEILRETNSVLVGGVMNAVGASPLQKAVAFGYNSRYGLGGARYHVGGEAGEAESAYLGIFDAKALKEVSGYDENTIRGEDWELAQRLKARGGKVWFSPELSVNYWPRSTVQALAKQFYATGVWRGELTRRAPGKAGIRYFIPPVGLLIFADLLLLSGYGAIDSRVSIIAMALYLMLLAFAAATAKSLDLLARLAIFLALPVMHLSWALGFWIGLAFGAKKIVDSGAKR